MKRSALFVITWLLLGSVCLAQQNPADAPASKEDIQKYLAVMHTRDLMKSVSQTMSKQMRQVTTEMLKKQSNVTPEMEERVNKIE